MSRLLTEDGKILFVMEGDLTGVVIEMADNLVPRLSRRKTDRSPNVWIEVAKSTEVIINGVKY